MRMHLAAAALFLAANVSVAPAYGETQLLHSCTGKALMGAGAGGVVGGLIGHDLKGAAVGAAVAGLGTFGVCRYLTTRSAARIDKAYQYAAASDKPYKTSWKADGGYQTLHVARPVRDGSSCKTLHGTLDVPGQGVQTLPQETYCRGSNGAWRSQG